MMPHTAAVSADPAAPWALWLPVVWLLWYTLHRTMDHWGQSTFCALNKDQPGPLGHGACARHVAAHTTGLLLATLTAAAIGAPVTVLGAAAALTLNAVSHYYFDRRTGLHNIAVALRRAEFIRFGSALGSGSYALDQDAHRLVLIPAAMLTVAPPTAAAIIGVFVLGSAAACLILARIGASIDADHQAAETVRRAMDARPRS